MQNSIKDMDIKNRLLDSVGEGKVGMSLENIFEICILLYVKQMTSPGSMRETGHSKPVHWDNPQGWDGEGGRREVWNRRTHVHPWLIHVNVWQNPPQCCSQLPIKINKLINFKKKNKKYLSLVFNVK